MATLTPAQVYALARDAGLNPGAAVTATAIAMAESGLRTDAVGDTTITTSKWGPSIGLWQIRSVKAESGRGTSRDATRLMDPAFNARSMVEISGGGTSWRPWSVFLHGSYRQYLPQVTAAAGGQAPQGSSSSDFAGVDTSGTAGVTETGGLFDSLNPFSGWQDAALKLVVTGAALGLVVIGAVRTVTPDRSA